MLRRRPDQPKRSPADWPAILGSITAALVMVPLTWWARSDPAHGAPWLFGVAGAAIALCVIIRICTGEWPN